MPYKMYHPKEQVTSLDTHGQSWRGETVQENIDLCPYQFIEPVFRQYLPRNGKILESGCGIGRWVFYLRDLGYDIIGIDLAVDALRIAKERDPAAPIYPEDILHTSYPAGSFDAVISLGVVEHFEEGPQMAFQETRRLLKNGGLFLVTVPVQNVSRTLFANLMKELKRRYKQLKGVEYVFEEYRYTRREFESLLGEANFEILAVSPDDFKLPKNIGLYIDYPFLRHNTNKWELNGPGRVLSRLLNTISPWLSSAGAIWICRKIS